MTTVYISNSGNDTTGAGTLASPWRTLQRAYTGLVSGDTVICRGGSYGVAHTFPPDGVTVRGYQSETPVFNTTIGDYPHFAGSDTTHIGITFNGQIILSGSRNVFENCNFGGSVVPPFLIATGPRSAVGNVVRGGTMGGGFEEQYSFDSDNTNHSHVFTVDSKTADSLTLTASYSDPNSSPLGVGQHLAMLSGPAMGHYFEVTDIDGDTFTLDTSRFDLSLIQAGDKCHVGSFRVENVIEDCTIDVAEGDGATAAISLYQHAYGCIVHGNTVTGPGAAEQAADIYNHSTNNIPCGIGSLMYVETRDDDANPCYMVGAHNEITDNVVSGFAYPIALVARRWKLTNFGYLEDGPWAGTDDWMMQALPMTDGLPVGTVVTGNTTDDPIRLVNQKYAVVSGNSAAADIKNLYWLPLDYYTDTALAPASADSATTIFDENVLDIAALVEAITDAPAQDDAGSAFDSGTPSIIVSVSSGTDAGVSTDSGEPSVIVSVPSSTDVGTSHDTGRPIIDVTPSLVIYDLVAQVEAVYDAMALEDTGRGIDNGIATIIAFWSVPAGTDAGRSFDTGRMGRKDKKRPNLATLGSDRPYRAIVRARVDSMKEILIRPISRRE